MGRRIGIRRTRAAANSRLRMFRGATTLAVALTAFLLLVFAPSDPVAAQTAAPPPTPAESRPAVASPDDVLPAAAVEAEATVSSLWAGFVGLLPKILVVLATLLAAWILARVVRAVLRASLRHWQRAEAFATVSAIGIWVLAIGIGVSVLVGDVRALVGSIGFVGLALSWALQTPIESFAGWMMNSFRGYYDVGDRIAVGDIVGDVYRIDFLNTTLWEIGRPTRDGGYVHAEQPTGRLITFPNSEALTGSIINFTRDFPWVWDEIEFFIANESDLAHAAAVLKQTATDLLGAYMEGPAREYEAILRKAALEREIHKAPEVYLTANDWATVVIIRYLVGARERRAWKSRLFMAVEQEIRKPEHAGRIIPVYPRQQIEMLGHDLGPTS